MTHNREPDQDRTEQFRKRWSVQRHTTFGWALGAYFVAPANGIHDRSMTLRLGRRTVTLYREREGQPWPEVGECHRDLEPGHACPQHDPSHEHSWQAGKPSWPGGGIPVRCIVCGARKCDMPRCIRIRHHYGKDHSDWLGYNGQVVAS